MSTDQGQDQELEPQGGDPSGSGDSPSERRPSWWHRDHPTFAALAGFFTGLVFVIVVPGGFIGLLSLLVSDETAETLFPLVVITLVVPIGLAIHPRTRRFGLYMLLGMVTTALVVGGVSALVLWLMVSFQS